jgi:hypothetical protein
MAEGEYENHRTMSELFIKQLLVRIDALVALVFRFFTLCTWFCFTLAIVGSVSRRATLHANDHRRLPVLRMLPHRCVAALILMLP